MNKMYVRNNQAVMPLVSNYKDSNDKMDFLYKIGRHFSTFASGAVLQSAKLLLVKNNVFILFVKEIKRYKTLYFLLLKGMKI